ncbi:BrnT family toxin [Patescibacteria group bacterium]|nr:BrnT family toxin [Patescibacteria group bacterium]
MKHIEWDELKNTKLKSQRGVCFEDIQAALEEGYLLDDIDHPNQVNYKNQRMYIVNLNQYAYLVPYIEDDAKIFLKTIIPNREATKKYIRKD